MAIVTTLTVPVSQIIIRNMLITSVNMESAGIWQGMMRISDGYLLLFTTSLATYYLPKLSSLKTDKELRSEIVKGYKFIIPAVLVSCSVIFFARFNIIKVLFTPDFIEMTELFFYQLVGDFFKIAAYILGYVIVAKSMTTHFIITEIGFTILYVILAFTYVSIYGLEGISIAFAVTYFIYFLVMVLIFRDILFVKSK
jgi:PST family polysaccharide transporter